MLVDEDITVLKRLIKSEYWEKLMKVADYVDKMAVVNLKDKSTPDPMIKYWQGIGDGVATFLLTIKSLSGTIEKEDNNI